MSLPAFLSCSRRWDGFFPANLSSTSKSLLPPMRAHNRSGNELALPPLAPDFERDHELRRVLANGPRQIQRYRLHDLLEPVFRLRDGEVRTSSDARWGAAQYLERSAEHTVLECQSGNRRQLDRLAEPTRDGSLVHVAPEK